MLAAPIIALTGFTLIVVFYTYMYYSSRHKERMALIESGKTAEIFKEIRAHDNNLKYGMVALAVGAGIFLGNFVHKLGFPEPTAYFSMIFILGGLALIGFYWFAKKGDRE